MLKDTNIWTTGSMDLYLNNEPVHVYVPETNVKQTYENLEARLQGEGTIPIGIDHLPDEIIDANPILAKLNLLHVGDISEITYANDTITIEEAELTNPLIQELYDNGELEMVSIVAESTVSECPQDYDYIVDSTDIIRVDIVEKGACEICNIPKPQTDNGTVVYARYPIQTEEEETMAEEAITLEQIEELIDKKIDEKFEEFKKQIDKSTTSTNNGGSEEKSEEIKAMKAEIAKLTAERATAKVDMLISEGKILPAQKESAVKLCATDAAMFDEMYKDAPVVVDLNARNGLPSDGNDGNGGGNPEPTPEEKNLNNVLSYFNEEE